MRGISALVASLGLSMAAAPALAVDVDRLPDLTGGVVPLVAFDRHDTFSNEFIYIVRVRNLTGDSLVANTLVLILDRIMDTSGKDAMDRIEVLNKSGQTSDGKPYFRIPSGQSSELPSYSESPSVTVSLRFPDYTAFAELSFRVRGQRRAPLESLEKLILELKDKGVLSEEEAQNALHPQ